MSQSKYLGLLLLFVASLAIWQMEQGHYLWLPDFSLYLAQAQAIHEGTVSQLLADNTEFLVRPALYPWGFPLILSTIWPTFGFELFAYKLLILAFFLGILVLSYRLFSPKIGAAWALLIAAALGLNPFLLRFTNYVLSDLPFLFFLLSFMLLYERSTKNEHRGFWTNVGLGLLAVICLSIRLNGVALLATLLFRDLIAIYKGNFKNFSRLLPSLMMIVFLVVDHLWLPSGGGLHWDMLSDLLSVESLSRNLSFYLLLPSHLFGRFFPLFVYVLHWPIFLLGLYFGFRQFRFFTVFCLATLCLYLIWPAHQGHYLFPVYPLLMYFIFLGYRKIGEALFITPIKQKILAYSFVLILGLQAIVVAFRYSNFKEEWTTETPAVKELIHYINHEIPSSAVTVYQKPRVLGFYTNKHCVSEESMDKYHFKTGGEYFHVREYPLEGGEPIFKNDLFFVYKIYGR